MAVSRRLRFEILRRDGYACRYCGAKAPDVVLTVDHVLAVTLGGGDEPNNLVAACQPCNAGKSSIAPDAEIVEDVDATALLFARALEEAAYRRRCETQRTDSIIRDVVGHWDDFECAGKPVPKGEGWYASLARFVELGLDLEDMFLLVDVAMASKAVAAATWRYFCGCCWNELSKRQEMARRLIEDGEV